MRINASKHAWTAAERQLLRDLYPDVPAKDIAALLCIGLSAIYNQAFLMGLKKSADFHTSGASGLRELALTHPKIIANRFKAGMTTWNAGKKIPAAEGSKPTQFKPGRRPHTWLPIGSYRITADGSLEQKVADVPGPNNLRWHPVARLVWEKAFGSIPSGHLVVFKPGTRTNVLDQITPDALECIHRAENLRRNDPRTISPELGKLVQLRGAISRQINKRSKEQTQGASA